MRRWVALAAILLSAYILVGQRDFVRARLTALLAPAPAPGHLTEFVRPDLSDGNPDRFPEFTATTAFATQTLIVGGEQRTWSMLSPQPASSGSLPPLVLLLHGSKRNGAAMLQMWQDVARQGVMLVAPDASNPDFWDAGRDGVDFLRAVLDAAYAMHPYDRQRVYLSGHSAGAIYALALAACAGGPWKAVAVHAGALPDCMLEPRVAKVPVLIQIGTEDPLFDLARVRHSATDLVAAGHDVTLEIIPDHGHWFYEAGPKLAADAWKFLNAPPKPETLVH